MSGDLRRAGVVARVEIRATARRLTGDRRQLVAVLLGFGQFVLWPFALFGQITGIGSQIAAGNPPLGLLGGVVTAATSAGLFVGGGSAINRNRVGDVGPLLRSSLPPRAVAIGRLASELGQTALLAAPTGIVVVCLVAVGAGGPVAPGLVVLAVCLPLAAGVLVGRAVGSLVRYAGFLTGLSVWTKLVLFLVGMVGILGGTQAAISSVFEGSPFGFGTQFRLPGRPVVSYLETVFVPVGTDGSLVGAGLVTAALLAVPVGLFVAARYETLILLRDEATEATDSTAVGSGRIPRPFARFPATRVAWRQLRRSKRDPRSMAHLFSFVAGPAAGAGYLAAEPQQTLRILGPALVVFGSLLAGAMYCLNPMGDDREQLPWLLSSLPSTAVLLRGRMLAGMTVGGLLGAVGVAVTAIWLSPAVGIGLAVVFPALLVAGPGVALGLGSLAPKFERAEYLNVERAQPSQPALLGYFLLGTIVLSLAPVILWLWDTGLIPTLATAVGLTVYLAVLLFAALVGYAYARRSFDRLTMDRV